MASLPRPSRPSLNPPSAPLPSIPRSRPTTAVSPAASTPGTPSSSGLPVPPTRSASSSSIPSLANGPSTSSAVPQPSPNSRSPISPAPQGKSLKKVASYSVFPKAGSPTANGRPSSSTSNASTATTPRTSQRASSLYNGVPGRASTSTINTRLSAANTLSSKTSPATPSVAVDLPESESAIIDDDEPRGRPASVSTQKDKGNVIISVRVKPEQGDKDANNTAAGEWMVDGRQSLVSFRGKEGGQYYYDNVFTPHDKNAKVYDAGAKRLVRRVMEGYHGTVFAYGMTGTGKTYSMQGTAQSPGVIPLAITDIFSFIRETPQREFLLRVSYLEIYNENIHDLLSAPLNGNGQGVQQQEEIKLREDSKRGVYATPLKEEIVQSPTQLLRVIARGDHARRTSSTQFNARSSRSHAVVQIVVESRERNAGGTAVAENKRAPVVPGGVRVSTLSLIDLAGSERAAESKERRTEGAHINKSLLTLGTVISKLSTTKDKNGQPLDKAGPHLPYRDSKLTRLLQSALSGNSLISILCTIQIGSSGSAAAAGSHTMETLNTLKFAARARNNIVSHAKKAEEAHGNMGDAGSRALLDRYRLEILDLRKQLDGQKIESQKNKDEEEEKAREAEEAARHEERRAEMQLASIALKERIEHLNKLILSSKSVGVNAGRSRSGSKTQRGSTLSTVSAPARRSRSARSIASTADSSKRTSAASSVVTLTKMEDDQDPIETTAESLVPEEEEEDTLGENGDGTATLALQVKNLQADLADKNRYISTLEKRLLQARRNSRSRVSMTFQNRTSTPIAEDEGLDALIRDKDAEIADLRARLDDKDRMVAALKSAARKRDTADSRPPSTAPTDRSSIVSVDAISNARPPSVSRRHSGANSTNGMSHSTRRSLSGSQVAPSSLSKVTSVSDSAARTSGPASPVGRLLQLEGGTPPKDLRRNHGVDEMTRMLDEMIKQKAATGGGSIANQRWSTSRRHSGHIITGSQASLASQMSDFRSANGLGEGAASSGAGPPSSAGAAVALSSKPSTTPPKSPRTSHRVGVSVASSNDTRLSGWDSDIQRRRSLRSAHSQHSANTSGTSSHSIQNGSQFTAVPDTLGHPSDTLSNGISSPSTTVKSSPTVPFNAKSPNTGGSRPTTSERISSPPPLPPPPRPEGSYAGANGAVYRHSGPLKVDELDRRERDRGSRDRDQSPGSDGTAILDEEMEDEVVNGGRREHRGQASVGLGIEA